MMGCRIIVYANRGYFIRLNMLYGAALMLSGS